MWDFEIFFFFLRGKSFENLCLKPCIFWRKLFFFFWKRSLKKNIFYIFKTFKTFLKWSLFESNLEKHFWKHLTTFFFSYFFFCMLWPSYFLFFLENRFFLKAIFWKNNEKKDFLSFEKIDLYSLKKKSLGKKKIFTFQNSFSEKQIKKK